jgi:hypothetical protein
MMLRAALRSFWVLVATAGCASTIDGSNSSSNCPLPGGTICPVGTRCPATDGCNTCTCGADRVLRCTELACWSDAGPSDAGLTRDAPRPPVDAPPGCVLPNGDRCAVGATCPAGDGCNVCACRDGVLACTGRACVTTCTSDADCPAGLGCAGAAGCATPWTCQHLLCANVASTWCDCAGGTFSTATACARRPYAHTGACEMTPPPDAGTCLAPGSVCRSGDECCSGWCPPRGAPISTCATPPSGTVPCYDRVCDAATEYCELTYSDVPTPDSVTCRPLPSACGGAATCGCVSHPCGPCEVRTSGALVFRCPGG